MSINFNQPFTHQTHQPISQEDLNISKDQKAALVDSIGNTAIAACSQSSSAESLSKGIVLEIPNQNPYQEDQRISLKALERGYLSREGASTIDLNTPLPEALQQEDCTTISDLLRKKFPLLTRSLLKSEIEIPKFLVSLGYKDEPFLQMEAKQEIVFIPSGSWTVKKTGEHTYNIGLKKTEEDVTIIGILAVEPDYDEVLKMFMSHRPRRVPFSTYSSSPHESNCRCCLPEELRKALAALPYICKDREKRPGQELYPFCVEISL